MKPSYEELEIQLCQTKRELAGTRKELLQTKRELAETKGLLVIALKKLADLEEKLNLNSKNSSKPPSADQKGDTSFKLPKIRSNREGFFRAMIPSERIDKRITCTQEICPHCGSHDIKLREQSPEILQQIELPEIRALAMEYALSKYSCNACGKNSTAKLPEGVPYSNFGPKFMAIMTTLTGLFHLAKREVIQIAKNLFDIDIGLGSISNIEERVSQALDPVCQRIHTYIIESTFSKHFDETTWRDSGKRHFVWIASCQHAAYYLIDRTRSAEAFRRLVGKELHDFSAVTDRYAVYNSIEQHQYCFAHLIRDFRKYFERDGPDREIGGALVKELSLACQLHKKYREGKIGLAERDRRLEQRKCIVETWFEDGMANGSDKLSRLCEKLLDNFDKLWVFMEVSGMEPTNNLAERDIRGLVIWRKKSYGTRSERGRRFVEVITGVSQTLKKNKKNVFTFLQEAVMNFYRNEDAPFICESLGF